MSILWRYFLAHFSKIFFLSISGFISLLFVSRLKDIARFLSLSSEGKTTLSFLLLQIPHILPIAIPISAFFASYFLMQKISHTNELTAIRSLGVSIKTLFQPLIVAALFLSIINIYFCFEITPLAKYQMRKLLTDKTSKNPLFLMQKKELLPIEQSYLFMKGNENNVEDFLFIGPKSDDHSLFLVTANQLGYKDKKLHGKNISSIFFLENENSFDTLFLENEKEISSYAPLLTQSLKKNHYRTNPSSLPMRLVFLHAKEKSTMWLEILRRLSLGFAPFTFVLLGASFGMEISRRKKEKMMQAFLLCSLLLLAYLAGKQMKAIPLCSACCFILPHMFLFFFSFRRINRIARGNI